MPRTHGFRRCLLRSCGVAVIASVVLATAPGSSATVEDAVRVWRISYSAHNGVARPAYVVLPAWYGPERNPPLPVVISPHGRGGDGRSNAKFWGDLPAVGQFAVINPDGMGRRFERFSYGYSGQIDDLARMPNIAVRALPWLHLDRERVYALGTSMGGQETLLLVARHPRLLAGAVAMDSVTDLARRYDQLPGVPCNAACLERWGTPFGRVLQATLLKEVGGAPADRRLAYAARSARSQARRIADSGVPLQLWWSSGDQIVFDQEHQSAALARDLRRLSHCTPVVTYAGTWRHSQAMWAGSLLPVALAGLGLIPDGFPGIPRGPHENACVPLGGLSGIPAVIAAGLRCRLVSGAACA
jgi:pimeloyl-ACP methyl ester carboxylesterase